MKRNSHQEKLRLVFSLIKDKVCDSAVAFLSVSLWFTKHILFYVLLKDVTICSVSIRLKETYLAFKVAGT